LLLLLLLELIVYGKGVGLMITQTDYLLGVADLTGELMRLCVGLAGFGKLDQAKEVGNFLQKVQSGTLPSFGSNEIRVLVPGPPPPP
jgi:hypothetical protein